MNVSSVYLITEPSPHNAANQCPRPEIDLGRNLSRIFLSPFRMRLTVNHEERFQWQKNGRLNGPRNYNLISRVTTANYCQ